MEFAIDYALICILYYLIGSIPMAYLVVKKRHGKDIRSEGTGNVGAMNSYDVTSSKATGIIVFILDFLKGVLPVLFITYLLELPMSLVMLPSVLLVLGHNYSVFLKFKGGRGLATAAGVVLVLNFLLLILWCVLFVISILIKRNVHIANVAATALLPMPVIFFQSFFARFTYENPVILLTRPELRAEILIVLCSSICLLILLKHTQPIFELIKERRIKNEQKSQPENN